jgi:hypothetical protein
MEKEARKMRFSLARIRLSLQSLGVEQDTDRQDESEPELAHPGLSSRYIL